MLNDYVAQKVNTNVANNIFVELQTYMIVASKKCESKIVQLVLVVHKVNPPNCIWQR